MSAAMREPYVQRLAVLADIETHPISSSSRDAQRHQEADHLQHDEGHDAGPQQRDADAVELAQHTAGRCLRADRRRRAFPASPTRRAAANTPTSSVPVSAADAVHAEHVERVVVAELAA